MTELLSGKLRQRRLALVGASGGTHIGGSFQRAASRLNIETSFFDVSAAWGSSRIRKSLYWRFFDRKPPLLARFADGVVASCRLNMPEVLITTGMAPLLPHHLESLRRMGIRLANFSTDDPWNRRIKADWFLSSLRHYDHVFTPRRANIYDFKKLMGPAVHYLPFAYDDELFSNVPVAALQQWPEVLFVGGADSERVAFMTQLIRLGAPVSVAGGLWDRYRATRPHTLGLLSPDQLHTATKRAKINLCLVRRANRDGHVMRTFEIPAIGGCMLAEDTFEHRELFGRDGDLVHYFSSPAEAADCVTNLLTDEVARVRLARAAHEAITTRGNTYLDRLSRMIAVVEASEGDGAETLATGL